MKRLKSRILSAFLAATMMISGIAFPDSATKVQAEEMNEIELTDVETQEESGSQVISTGKRVVSGDTTHNGQLTYITDGDKRATDDVDGNYWVGNFVKSQGADNGATSEFYIDLGEEPVLVESIATFYRAKAWPTYCEYQVSNDEVNWYCADTVERSNGNDKYLSDDIQFATPVHARYVKVIFKTMNHNASALDGVGVIECEVTGKVLSSSVDIVDVTAVEDIAIEVGGTFSEESLPKLNEVTLSTDGGDNTEKATVPVLFENKEVDTTRNNTTTLTGQLVLNGIANTTGKNVPVKVIVGTGVEEAAPITLSGSLDKIYDGIAVKPDETEGFQVETQGITGNVTYTYYNEQNCTTALEEAPMDAGTYWMKASITTETGVVTSNAFTFTIDKAALTIANATVEPQIVEEALAANVTGVNFQGLVGEDTLVMGEDYTAEAVYDNVKNAAEVKKVTVTVALKDAVANYKLTEENAVWVEENVNLENVVCTVTFQNEEESITQEVVFGTGIEKPEDPSKEDYKFLGWYEKRTENEKIAYVFGTPVTKDILLIAEWESQYEEDLEEAKKGIWVAGNEDRTYNGTKQTQKFRVYDGTKLLEEGVDYTVSYKNNTNVYECEGGFEKWDAYIEAVEGKDTEAAKELKADDIKKFKNKAPQVILKMKGIYGGTKNIYFKIQPADIKEALEEKIIVLDNLKVSASAKPQKPAVTVLWKETGKNLKLGKDYKLVVKNSAGEEQTKVGPGSYSLTVTGIGNFKGIIEDQTYEVVSTQALSQAKVKVKKVEWADAVNITEEEAFAEKVIKEVKKGNTKLYLGTDYKVVENSITNRDEVGTGYLTIEGIGSFTGTKTIAYTINGIAMSKVSVTGVDRSGYEYTGKAIKPLKTDLDIAVTYKRKMVSGNKIEELKEGNEFTVTYQKNKNKGTATMLLTGNPSKGYTGTKKVTFKVTAYNLKETGVQSIALAEGNNNQTTYTTGGATPKVIVVDVNGNTLKEGVDYTLSYKNNKEIGGKKTPLVTVKGKGNYTKTTELPFSIVPKDINAVEECPVTISVKDKTYKGASKNWKQSFKVLDENGKVISNKEYDFKYTLEGQTQEIDPNAQLALGDTIQITVTFKDEVGGKNGNYRGVVTETYRLIKKEYDISKATIKIKNQEYTGDAIVFTKETQAAQFDKFFIKIDGEEIPLVIDENIKVVSYQKNIDKGTAKVTFRGMQVEGGDVETGLFGGEKTVSFKIVQRDVIKNWWDKLLGNIGDEEPEADVSGQYAIYPIPQNVVYGTGGFVLKTPVAIVAESGIDTPTLNYVKEVLDKYQIAYEVTENMSKNKTNILLGTYGSNGFVEQYVNTNSNGIEITTANIWEKPDAHVVDVKNNKIVIYGSDTDSVFHGVSTLKMMFSSFDGAKFPAVHIEDYASVESRGFIEGFYGSWNHQARMDLMRFAKDYKMNSYVYAAKDDAYHTSSWHVLYPEEKLAQFEELVAVGEETKVRFAWSVHMGSFFSGLTIPSDEVIASAEYASMTQYDLYRTRYAQLIAKFEQLIEIGVKRFDILNDDFGSGNNDDVVLVLNRINKDLKDRGCETITYCPQGYNKSWSGNGAELAAMKNLDEDIKIYWTGDDVNAPITQDTINFVTEKSGHSPDFWLNYPVNEHAKSGIFLGHIKHYARDGVTGLAGFHSNPCRYPYASQVGLYQLAALVWNNNNYLANAEMIWESAFDYLQPEVRDAYFKIANNISNAPNSGRVGNAFPESDYIEELLNTVLSEVTSGQEYKDSENVAALKEEFVAILAAIEEFTTKCENQGLIDDLTPWLKSLKDLATAGRDIMESALALRTNDLSTAWEKLSSASAAYTTTYTYQVNYEDSNLAKAGSKRIYPFVTSMISYVTNALTPMLNPDNAQVVPTAYVKLAGTVRNDDDNAKKMYDGDITTVAIWNNVQQVGDYVGLDFGRAIKVRDVKVVQGSDDADHDILHKAYLQYSVDGEQWINIDAEVTVDGHWITADDLNVTARYVRYYLYETGTANKADYWTHIREFTVNKPIPTGDRVYTNVESLKETPVTYEGTTVSLHNLGEVLLQPGDYVGIKLLTPATAYSFVQQISVTEGLTLEYSYNEGQWSTVENNTANVAVKYFRLINKTNAAVTTDIEKLEINLQRLKADMALLASTMNGGVKTGSYDLVFDGDRSTYVETNGNQQANNYIAFDLGKNIEIHDVTLVTTDGSQTFSQAKVQISSDNSRWTDIGVINNNMEFPGPPYKYFECNGNGAQARYLRIYITADYGNTLKLNEIEINQQVEGGKQAEEIVSSMTGSTKAVIDNNIGTALIATANAGDYVEYCISENTNITQVNVLMGKAGMGKAYAVNSAGEEILLGTLEKSVSEFTTTNIAPITAIRLKWEQTEQIAVHEILLVRGAYSGSDIGVYTEPVWVDGNQGISAKMLLSEGMPVQVSGTSAGDKGKINDGVDVNDNTNKWDSNFIKGADYVGNTAWFSIDLGEIPVLIDELYVHYFNKIYPTAYELQVSNDHTNWYTVKTFTKEHNGGTYPTETISLETPVHARYVRWFFTELNSAAAGNGVGVIEAKVFGRIISADADITAVAAVDNLTLSVGEEFNTASLPVLNRATVAVEGVDEVLSVEIPVSYENVDMNTSVEGTTTLTGQLQLSGISNTTGKKVSVNVTVGSGQ